jgi:thioredoxin reductase
MPKPSESPLYDAVVVGGGPAGMNAALVLGRCRRRVLLCDAGRPRNAVSPGVNGYLTRDGCKPHDLRRIGRRELGHYPQVELRQTEVIGAERADGRFTITLAEGERVAARRLLLATGLSDDMPPIEGFREFYGRGVHNCPYCDGYEHQDEPMAVYGRGKEGVGLALEMTLWSRDLVLLTDGTEPSRTDRRKLKPHGIVLDTRPLERLEGGERLERVRFKDGAALERRALFFIHGQRKASPLVVGLGCELTEKGTVRTLPYERTNVPGLYVAGDASYRVQFAIVAAAEGAMAAFAINTDLLKEDLG